MKTYEIAGDRIRSAEDFYIVIGEAVNGPGGYFGSNLDALSDCLRGGFGTPDTGGFQFRWLRHAESARNLGYSETLRQLEFRLERCHPSNRAHVEADLANARRQQGPTVFDWIVSVFQDQDSPLELA
jgi:RNAse (barnase) inhibitor barstar